MESDNSRKPLSQCIYLKLQQPLYQIFKFPETITKLFDFYVVCIYNNMPTPESCVYNTYSSN